MNRGFTLVEVLASMALIAILAFVLVQILDGVQRGERTSTARIDAADQAAFVFDRLASDLGAFPARMDAPLRSNSTEASNEFLRFGASVEGFDGERRFSVVSYSLVPSGLDENRKVLQRSATALNWNDSGLLGVNDVGERPLFDPWPSNLSPGANDHEMLGEGVFHMVVGYKLRESVGSRARGSVVYSPPLLSGGDVNWSKVGSLEVTLVALDARTIQNLTPAEVEAIRTQFPTPADGDSAFRQWRSVADDHERFQSMAPLAAKRLRVFARSLDLPTLQP